MIKKTAPIFLILAVVCVSILIVILPTFYSKGLSRVELNQDLDLKLVLDSAQDVELVFFGYAGCIDVCTPRLDALGKWYATLPLGTQEKVGVRFMDLSVPKERSLPDTFAKAFHERFTGVFLDESVLRIYAKAFSVYFSKSLMKDDEIDHSTHLYLVQKDTQGKKLLRFIYTAYPYDFTQIQSDIQELINE